MTHFANGTNNFRGRLPIAAVIVSLLGALGHGAASSASSPFQVQTQTCAGCNICLTINQTGVDPFRVTAQCSTSQPCQFGAPNPYRFVDLTSHRGMLQVVSESTDFTACPASLYGMARWDGGNAEAGANVFFTGPGGPGVVTTRVRHIVSTACTNGMVTFSGRLYLSGFWTTPIPSNVTNMEITSPFETVGLNSWVFCFAGIETSIGASSGTTCAILHFPLNSPVFDLPPGYTANSPALGIVDNIWHGLDIVGDWNATTGDVSCFNSMHLIHSVTGDLIVDDTGATVIDLGGVSGVGGDLTISDNTSATEIDLGGTTGVGGDLTVSGNTSAGGISLGNLSSTGSVNVSGNTSATGISLGNLSSTGSVNVSGNTSASGINLGSLSSTSGGVTASGNGTGSGSLDGADIALSMNFASLTTVDGNLNISANSADTTVTLGPLALVMGDLTLETKAPPGGTLDLSGAAVAGNVDVTAKDADALSVGTSATGGISGGSSNIAITRDDSLISLSLPAGTFARRELLTAQRIDPNTLPVLDARDPANQPIKIDAVAVYHLDADDATLNEDAALDLEVNVSALPGGPSIFLAALASNRVMLARRGNGAKDLYHALDICPANNPPTTDGCVTMTRYDQNHLPLPPESQDAPAFVRFSAATRQIVKYAVVIKLRPGDVTADGIVNIDDLVQVITRWGACAAPCPADVNSDGTVNIDDLVLVITNWD